MYGMFSHSQHGARKDKKSKFCHISVLELDVLGHGSRTLVLFTVHCISHMGGSLGMGMGMDCYLCLPHTGYHRQGSQGTHLLSLIAICVPCLATKRLQVVYLIL